MQVKFMPFQSKFLALLREGPTLFEWFSSAMYLLCLAASLTGLALMCLGDDTFILWALTGLCIAGTYICTL